MRLLVLCPQWGHEHLPIEQFLTNVKEAGYDGVETWMPEQATERKELIRLLGEYKLPIVSHQHQANGDNIGNFCRSFEYYLNVSMECGPLFINSHSGRDYFTLDEQLQVLDVAFNFSAIYGIDIYHETHRGRMFFSPGNASALFQARPNVKITADLSHWVCVSENLHLRGFESILAEAIQKTAHIHARVGFEEGPQITDPRLPEWQKEVDVFLAWWDQMLTQQASKSTALSTLTPEFGPFPYMWQLPGTLEPVASQWNINVFMKTLLKERFQQGRLSAAE
jgi:sugar phosphate isomerase/epimerase